MSVPAIRAEEARSPHEVPSTWGRKRLRCLVSQPIRNDSGVFASNGSVPLRDNIGTANESGPIHHWRDVPANFTWNPNPDARERQEDLLISVSAATLGEAYHATEYINGMKNVGRVLRLTPNPDMDSSFLVYWTQSLDYWNQINASAAKERSFPRDTAMIRNLRVPTPSLETQRRIARFLDRETGQIDDVIGKKKVLLDELTEWRESLIARAVTGELNSGVSTKTSGVGWVDNIPEHWRVLPLKRLLNSSTRGTADRLQPSGEVAVLREHNLVNGEIDFGDLGFLSEAGNAPILAVGDVVLNCAGGMESFGNASILRDGANLRVSFSSELVRLRFQGLYNPEFANRVIGTKIFNSFRQTAIPPSIIRGNAAFTRFVQIRVPVPPIEEQFRIVSHLNDMVGRINHAKELINSSIGELGEYRSAIISEAVMGKLGELQ